MAQARQDLLATLTDTCDIVSTSEGWNGPEEALLGQDVPVRLAPGPSPSLDQEGDRIDPNQAAVAYLPVDTAVEPGNIIRFPDTSEYRVVGIFPRPDAFRFLLKVAVAWA